MKTIEEMAEEYAYENASDKLDCSALSCGGNAGRVAKDAYLAGAKAAQNLESEKLGSLEFDEKTAIARAQELYQSSGLSDIHMTTKLRWVFMDGWRECHSKMAAQILGLKESLEHVLQREQHIKRAYEAKSEECARYRDALNRVRHHVVGHKGNGEILTEIDEALKGTANG